VADKMATKKVYFKNLFAYYFLKVLHYISLQRQKSKQSHKIVAINVFLTIFAPILWVSSLDGTPEPAETMKLNCLKVE
jgi:hypothetical protein